MLDRAGRHVAGEVEAAEEVAQLLLAHVAGELLEMPERRLMLAQHLDLVLREVADLHAFVGNEAPRQGRQHAGDRLLQRGLARPVHPEESNSVPGLPWEGD